MKAQIKLIKENGFTLVEMLIVVSILGIITSVAVPALNSAKADAQRTKQDALTSAIETAKNRYALANNVSGYMVNFAEIQPYLIVNGHTPSEDELTLAENNGTGKYIVGWGNYQQGTEFTPIEWSDSPPVQYSDYTQNDQWYSDWSSEDWSYRDYSGAQNLSFEITGTNLSNSRLNNTYVSSFMTNGVDFSGVDFTGATFLSGAISNPQNLTAAQLLQAADLGELDLQFSGMSRGSFEAAADELGMSYDKFQYVNFPF